MPFESFHFPIFDYTILCKHSFNFPHIIDILQGDVAPIVELKIVLPLENELCPEDWEYVKPSNALYPANFNWINPAQVPIYIIFRRGYDLKPICEIELVY